MSGKYEVVKFKNEEFELDVNVDPKEETVWLSQEDIALLFSSSLSTINYHINNIYRDEELNKESTFRKIRIVQEEGDRLIARNLYFYNLDVIISAGYRVKSKRGIEFRKWANGVLKKYLLKGYAINENRVTVSNENYIELKNEVVNINNRLNKLENKLIVKELKLDTILYDGQFYDCYTLVQSIFEEAINEIIIIDNYVDRSVLDRLVVKKINVNVIIYTNIKTSKLLGQDINVFNNQYGGLDVRYTTNVHDRYIIIDQNKIYHLGYSIKDLWKKIFSISESDSELIPKLLSNI